MCIAPKIRSASMSLIEGHLLRPMSDQTNGPPSRARAASEPPAIALGTSAHENPAQRDRVDCLNLAGIDAANNNERADAPYSSLSRKIYDLAVDPVPRSHAQLAEDYQGLADQYARGARGGDTQRESDLAAFYASMADIHARWAELGKR